MTVLSRSKNAASTGPMVGQAEGPTSHPHRGPPALSEGPPIIGGMRVESRVADWPAARIREALTGLPQAKGYRVVVKPLRYRTRPHLQATCDFEDRVITIQLPEPFHPFVEKVPYRARRMRGRGFRFQW